MTMAERKTRRIADGDFFHTREHPVAALDLAEALRRSGIVASAVRPPTVPAGTSRLRLSLKRSFGAAEAERVLVAMKAWRATR